MLQQLISNVTTTNMSFKTLAKSYFELASAKSQEWMRRVDLAVEAAACEGPAWLTEIIEDRYSDIINTPLPLEDGSAVSLYEYAMGMADATIDPTQYRIADKTGTYHTIESITEYLGDQAVNLTAQTCAFQAVIDATIDSVTGAANVQFSNYYNLVQSQLGEMTQRGKSIVNYYYNILSDATVDMTAKLQMILAPIQSAVTNYNEDDDQLNIEFFVPQETYTGISSFAAWCISNDLTWDDTWSAMKSGFKVIGTVVAGLWNGISTIADKVFGLAVKPFTSDTGVLKQRSKYTTEFIDVPVAQGRVSLDQLFTARFSSPTQENIFNKCGSTGLNREKCKQYLNDKLNSQSILSIDFTSFRILLWQDTDDSEFVSFIINVSPIATGSINSNPCVQNNFDGSRHTIIRGIKESLDTFKTDVIGDEIDLNDSAQTFKGLLASLNNMALVTGAGIFSPSVLTSSEVINLPAGTELTREQYELFIEYASYIGGYAINETPNLEQESVTFGLPNMFVDFGTNGDWIIAEGRVRDVTNSDITRIVCGGSFSIIGDEGGGDYAFRGRGIIAAVCWLLIRQHFQPYPEDEILYIPYTHVYSIGTPRFVVQGDPTGQGFAAWLSVAAIMAVTVAVLGVSVAVRKRRRRRLAELQAVQWSSTKALANHPVGSEQYNLARDQLVRANRKVQRIESLLEVTGATSLTSLAAGIDLTESSTAEIVKLIRP